MPHNPRTIVPNPGYSTITGNIFYRSAKPGWHASAGPDSCHVLLDGLRGVTCVGNTLVAGCDDADANSVGHSAQANWSPRQAFVLRQLANCIIKDNVLEAASLEQLIVDLGDHRGPVLVKDNLGSLFQPAPPHAG
ncbi:MAG: hypothetical protein ACYC26_00685 [Phycisphaerales bacterium]